MTTAIVCSVLKDIQSDQTSEKYAVVLIQAKMILYGQQLHKIGANVNKFYLQSFQSMCNSHGKEIYIIQHYDHINGKHFQVFLHYFSRVWVIPVEDISFNPKLPVLLAKIYHAWKAERALCFCMTAHNRLGCDSVYNTLPSDILIMIATMATQISYRSIQ